MRRKRLLAVILLAFLLWGCLPGCGPTEPSRAVPTAAQRQPEAITTAAPTMGSVSATLPAAPTAEQEPLPTMTPPAEAPSTMPDPEASAVTAEPTTVPTRQTETIPATAPEETEAPDRGVAENSPGETESAGETEPTEKTEPSINFIANTNTKKFHYPSCSSVSDMKEENKWYFTGTRDELIQQGYAPCKRCSP